MHLPPVMPLELFRSTGNLTLQIRDVGAMKPIVVNYAPRPQEAPFSDRSKSRDGTDLSEVRAEIQAVFGAEIEFLVGLYSAVPLSSLRSRILAE